MAKTVLIGSLLVCVLLPAFALAIASLVIASENKNLTCDGDMMPLPTWLNVYGGTSLGMCVLLIVSILLLIREHVSAMMTYIVVLIFYQLFSLAWNVVGAVALFRDSSDCKDQASSIWVMTLVVLIFQWIGFLQTCCARKSDD